MICHVFKLSQQLYYVFFNNFLEITSWTAAVVLNNILVSRSHSIHRPDQPHHHRDQEYQDQPQVSGDVSIKLWLLSYLQELGLCIVLTQSYHSTVLLSWARGLLSYLRSHPTCRAGVCIRPGKYFTKLTFCL